jgi:hypothetical protein
MVLRKRLVHQVGVGTAALLSVLLLLIATGCSHEFALHCGRLDPDSGVKIDGPVYLRDIRVGTIIGITTTSQGVIAHLAIEHVDTARDGLKVGLTFSRRNDGGIQLTDTAIADDAEPLPDGTYLEPGGRVTLLSRRYAEWQALLLAVVVILVVAGIAYYVPRWLRFGVVLVSLALAAVTASLLSPAVVAPLQYLYESLDEVPWAEVAASRPEGVAAAFTQEIGRPSPATVAFMGCWLIAFFVIQFILGRAFPPPRGRRNDAGR